MKRIPAVILAVACFFAAACAVFADNGTEVVIGDDLTVLGTDGTWSDPDFHVAGFTVFGSTVGTVSKLGANPSPGSVVITGNLQVDGSVYLPNLPPLAPSGPNSPSGVAVQASPAVSAKAPGAITPPSRLRRMPGGKAVSPPKTPGVQRPPAVSSGTISQ